MSPVRLLTEPRPSRPGTEPRFTRAEVEYELHRLAELVRSSPAASRRHLCQRANAWLDELLRLRGR